MTDQLKQQMDTWCAEARQRMIGLAALPDHQKAWFELLTAKGADPVTIQEVLEIIQQGAFTISPREALP